MRNGSRFRTIALHKRSNPHQSAFDFRVHLPPRLLYSFHNTDLDPATLMRIAGFAPWPCKSFVLRMCYELIEIVQVAVVYSGKITDFSLGIES